MDIVQRNLFRLLRSGAFQSKEDIEPMSAFKWGRLYQLAVMHDIIPFVYDGIIRCKEQFFVHLTDKQKKEWEKAIADYREQERKKDDQEEDEFLRPDRLTNPLLNSRLQDILDDEHSDLTSRQLLMIRKWIERLRLTQMTQLTGEFLIKLYGFEEEDIPFLKNRKEKKIDHIAQELIEFTNTRSQDWYFSQQDGGIFVHNTNSSATFSHVRRSARYFRYYPSESVTNFFASFVHSLSHIEE